MNVVGQDFLFPARFLPPSPVPQAGAATGIALLNTSSTESALVTIQFLQNGSLVSEVQLTLPPQTQIARVLNELGLLPYTPIGGIARIQSSQPLAVAVVDLTGGAWITVPASVTSSGP
jgi:hypothetical protein